MPAERPGRSDRFALAGSIGLVALLPFAIDPRLSSPGQGQLRAFQIGVLALLTIHLVLRIGAPLEGPAVPTPRVRPAGVDVPALAVSLAALTTVLSAALAPNPAYAFGRALLSLSGMALFYLLRRGGIARDLFDLAAPLVVLQAATLSACGLAQHLGFEVLPYAWTADVKSRVVATLGHPNFLASVLGPAAFLCLAHAAAAPRGRTRALSLGAAALSVIAILLARSHGVWLGVAAGAGTLAALTLARRLRFRPAALGLAAIVAVLAVAFTTRPAASLLRRSLVAGSNLESRLTFWRVAAGLHPPTSLLGVGAGGFEQRFWDELRRESRSTGAAFRRRGILSLTGEGGRPRDPGSVHDEPLQVWAESGGLALYGHALLVLYLVAFASARVLRGEAGAVRIAFLLGALVTTLVDSLVGFPLSLPCSLAVFWLVAACLDQEIARA